MDLVNDRYQIDGVDVLQICQTYGVPVYVYETAKMEQQYVRLQKAFANTNLKINYACKALTNINILKFFNSLGAGLDTVSIQELQLGLKAGFKPQNIIFTPNGVSFEEYQQAVELGVKINIDNLSILEHFGNVYGNSVPICIRINPHLLAGGNRNISVGGIDSKFGISIHQIPLLLRIVKNYNLNIEGLHMHTGSDILDADVFMRSSEILFDTAQHFDNLNYIDIGSGFKVAYKPDDITTDIEELGEKLSTRFEQFAIDYGKKLELNIEPGKFLVSEAGYFFVKTNIIKQTTSSVFAGVDSGFNHLIRPMFYNSYHQILNISNPLGKSRVYSVVGYVCETDTFALDRRIAQITEGDILGFLNAGAYCFAMSSNFNSRYRPAEVIIHKGQTFLIREREELKDLLNRQIEVQL